MALFRQCSSCRGDIQCGAVYWLCSVSTCQRQRTGLFFCSVPCWEAHLPTMRHRESWAVEERAPSAEKWARENDQVPDKPPEASKPAPKPKVPVAPVAPVAPAAPAVVRRPVGATSTTRSTTSDAELERDILIVVSKLKKYVRARSGFNTSDTAMDPLSDCVRAVCDKAIRIAGADGRKTVMDRDIKAAARD